MFKARQKLGKYRIEGRIANGPLAAVYRAFDPVMGIRVALKIPHDSIHPTVLEDFRKEVRLAVRLQHDNILPVLDARQIDKHFVIVTPLGKETLSDRLERRMATATAMELAEQALDAVAHAHERNIIHCDIKPENFILYPDNQLRLGDFAFAKQCQATIKASGSGTLGYIAPEQAMGRPMFQSDVFSLGLVLYRMFSGRLPEWPYDWPPVGYEQLKRRVHPEMIELIRKAIQVKPGDRFKDAVQMQAAFARARNPVRRQRGRKPNGDGNGPSWQTFKRKEFQRLFGRVLQTHYHCRHCDAPVAEAMQYCPWCSGDQPTRGCDTRFPAQCPRCQRGVKLDWNYCAWCYGPGFEKEGNRRYTDKRYVVHCDCGKNQPLMPHMKYCPWCRKKVRRSWPIKGSGHKCSACGNGVVRDFWDYCPWCRTRIKTR